VSAAEVDRAASGFPTYEVPAFVAERFPGFRPEDPSTWPEPDRCTEGRPWGHSAYGVIGAVTGAANGAEWRRYLAAVDAGPRGVRTSWIDRDKGCRNRWKFEEYRLCGTHLRPFLDRLAEQDRAARVRASTERYLDLGKRLAAHGIEGEARAAGVLLREDAIEGLLRLLDDRPFPSTDLTVPPPL
jgi:hypothetical protein